MCADTPEKLDYKSTLNLPKTDFPMRAGLPKREPEWLARWEQIGIYDRLRDKAKDGGRKRPALCQRPSPHRSRAQQNHQGHDRALPPDDGF